MRSIKNFNNKHKKASMRLQSIPGKFTAFIIQCLVLSLITRSIEAFWPRPSWGSVPSSISNVVNHHHHEQQQHHQPESINRQQQYSIVSDVSWRRGSNRATTSIVGRPSALADRAQLSSQEGIGIKGGGEGDRGEKGVGMIAVNKDDDEEEDPIARFVAECEIPTDRGIFRMRSYRCQGRFAALEPVALTYGSLRGKENVLARIHDQCLTSEVFGSKRCDCKEQLGMALDMIKRDGGIVIYLQQEGRGIGLANKVAAYALQDEGLDTVDANRHLGFGDDERTYDVVPSILEDLGVRSIQLMTNNPLKLEWIQSLGIKINRVVPIVVAPNAFNKQYLITKAERMSHILPPHNSLLEQAVLPKSLEAKALLSRRSVVVSSGVAAGKGGIRGSRRNGEGRWRTAEAREKEIGDGEKWDFGRSRAEEALGSLRQGRPIVLVDSLSGDEEGNNKKRRNSKAAVVRGDLILAAAHADASAIKVFMKATSGITYALLPTERLAELWAHSGGPAATAAGVDYRSGSDEGKEEGSSGGGGPVKGRAATLRALARREVTTLAEFSSPGHIFMVAPGAAIGVASPGLLESPISLRRAWALEMVGLAHQQVVDREEEDGIIPVAAVSELVEGETGALMDLPALQAFAEKEGLVLTSVGDQVRYCCSLPPAGGEGREEAI